MSNNKTPAEELTARYAQFGGILSVAERCFADGNLDASARLAQMAARRAFPHHIGVFASPRLERLLLNIGKRAASRSGPTSRRSDAGVRKVLHVLTYARPIGGDTRFVWRWIQLDRQSQHSVVITAQNELEHLFSVPESLKDAVARSGGFLRALAAPSSNPLEKAGELRELCQGMDMVILHLYPHDIVPVLALATGCDFVRVAFANLSDHTFWLGGSVSDLIVHLRSQSPDFLVSRRGLTRVTPAILPIPLETHCSAMTSAEAKHSLGYAPDKVVLLTIASPFKYKSLGDDAFLDLVTPILQESPQAVLLAVGPDPKGDWQAASLLAGGRIKALGTRWDNASLYAAADVYLDSVPFSSITSLLEAGNLGIPLLSNVSPNPDLTLLGPGAPGLDGAMEITKDAEDYRLRLRRLINDSEFRQRCGQRVREDILAAHAETNWASSVTAIYERLEQSSGDKCLAAENDEFCSGPLDLTLTHLYDWADRRSFRHEIQDSLGDLSYASRLSVLRHLFRNGFQPHWRNLLPLPLDKVLRCLGGYVRSIAPRSQSSFS
ncbi:MAG: glycosyltransferase family 4 protein [Verrucomicrobia bacterium]|nr:glycosyltransferase family 4 protein [Verrucomicrobiota bacterium]